MTDFAAPPTGAMVAANEAFGSKWGWAAYLGASWTWCIGMFLPVLLIRDFGPWAWVIFAVPNVVGAAAMGWVMRTAEMSRQYTVDHASACRLFSFVTIAFQLFFAVWMLPRLLGPIGYVGVAILVQSAFTPVLRQSWLRWAGSAVLLLSLALFAGMRLTIVPPDGPPSGIGMGEAIGLSLVCLAGFLTCPYLDLTFHRARIATNDADAKFAFGVGFGVMFAAMIVLTFFYAPYVSRIGTADLPRTLAICLALHWLTQMTYTVHVHAAELVRQAEARDDRGGMRSGMGVWLAVGLAIGLAGAFGVEHGIDFRGRSLGEAGYRTFMACYGLLFPAYVLLAIGRPRVSWLAWALVTLLALPFFWLAFIENRMPWATAGVAVIAVGAFFGRLRSADTPEAHQAL